MISPQVARAGFALLMVGSAVTPSLSRAPGAACVPADVAAHRSPSGASRHLGRRDPDRLTGVLKTSASSNPHTVNPHTIACHVGGGARIGTVVAGVSLAPYEDTRAAALVASLVLGANVPLERIDLTIAGARPNLVVLTAQRLHTAARLLEAARLAAETGFTVAFGGRAFSLDPSLRTKVPGFFLGETLPQGVSVAERLAESMPPSPPGEAIPERFAVALHHFREQRLDVHAFDPSATAGIARLSTRVGLASSADSRSLPASLEIRSMPQSVRPTRAGLRLAGDVLAGRRGCVP